MEKSVDSLNRKCRKQLEKVKRETAKLRLYVNAYRQAVAAKKNA